MVRAIWQAAFALLLISGPVSPETAAPFTEEAESRGLRFRHFNGGTGRYYLPESLGSGVALIDYDSDGDLDVYLLQGAALEPGKKDWKPAGASASNRLFRNLLREEGTLRFVDVTDRTGLRGRGYALGAAVGDYDGDGDPDLYVTCTGDNLLYRNNGDGTFSDVTAAAGVNDPRVSTAAAFFDYDRDNDLDLLVLSYVDFTVATNKNCPGTGGRPDYCKPSVYHPLPAKLFRNDGRGKFTDVSEESGIGNAAGAGLGIAIGDYNSDGWLDAYVANDGTPNHLWINQGNGTFVDTALEAGAAYDDSGRAEAGMGVAAGDYDADGDEDLIVANLMGETLTLYQNNGRGEFADVTIAAKLATPSRPFTGFGAGWLDYDHDGALDLFVANGSVERLQDLGEDPYPYGQRDQLFRNTRQGFAEVRFAALDRTEAGRGAAFGDLDLDGDVDIVVSNSNGPTRLFLNQTNASAPSVTIMPERKQRGLPVEGTWIGLHCKGRTPVWRRSTISGSYLSANDPAVHFGVNGTTVERVSIRWPDGREETRPGPLTAKHHTIRQRN